MAFNIHEPRDTHGRWISMGRGDLEALVHAAVLPRAENIAHVNGHGQDRVPGIQAHLRRQVLAKITPAPKYNVRISESQDYKGRKTMRVDVHVPGQDKHHQAIIPLVKAGGNLGQRDRKEVPAEGAVDRPEVHGEGEGTATIQKRLQEALGGTTERKAREPQPGEGYETRQAKYNKQREIEKGLKAAAHAQAQANRAAEGQPTAELERQARQMEAAGAAGNVPVKSARDAAALIREEGGAPQARKVAKGAVKKALEKEFGTGAALEANPAEEALRSGRVEDMKRIPDGGIHGGKYKATIEGRKVFIKLDSGIDQRWLRNGVPKGRRDGPQERAAGIVGNIIGVDGGVNGKMPMVVMRSNIGDRGPGMVKEWVDGIAQGGRVPSTYYRAKLWGIMDLVIGNLDRHGANHIQASNGVDYYPMDHGLTFPDDENHEGLERGLLRLFGKPLTPEERAAVQRIVDNRPVLDKQLVDSGLTAAQISSFWGRVMSTLSHNRYPTSYYEAAAWGKPGRAERSVAAHAAAVGQNLETAGMAIHAGARNNIRAAMRVAGGLEPVARRGEFNNLRGIAAERKAKAAAQGEEYQAGRWQRLLDKIDAQIAQLPQEGANNAKEVLQRWQAAQLPDRVRANLEAALANLNEHGLHAARHNINAAVVAARGVREGLESRPFAPWRYKLHKLEEPGMDRNAAAALVREILGQEAAGGAGGEGGEALRNLAQGAQAMDGAIKDALKAMDTGDDPVVHLDRAQALAQRHNFNTTERELRAVLHMWQSNEYANNQHTAREMLKAVAKARRNLPGISEARSKPRSKQGAAYKMPDMVRAHLADALAKVDGLHGMAAALPYISAALQAAKITRDAKVGGSAQMPGHEDLIAKLQKLREQAQGGGGVLLREILGQRAASGPKLDREEMHRQARVAAGVAVAKDEAERVARLQGQAAVNAKVADGAKAGARADLRRLLRQELAKEHPDPLKLAHLEAVARQRTRQAKGAAVPLWRQLNVDLHAHRMGAVGKLADAIEAGAAKAPSPAAAAGAAGAAKASAAKAATPAKAAASSAAGSADKAAAAAGRLTGRENYEGRRAIQEAALLAHREGRASDLSDLLTHARAQSARASAKGQRIRKEQWDAVAKRIEDMVKSLDAKAQAAKDQPKSGKNWMRNYKAMTDDNLRQAWYEVKAKNGEGWNKLIEAAKRSDGAYYHEIAYLLRDNHLKVIEAELKQRGYALSKGRWRKN